jgi:hypothetical protein
MAIKYGDGKAGQHAKRIAFQYGTRIMQLSMIGMAVGGGIIVLIPALYLHWRLDPSCRSQMLLWLLAALDIAIFVAVRAGLRWWDKETARLAKERIAWLRGAQGEALVAWYLNDLPNTWHVFHNVKLWKTGDLDHVLIGPGGLFCISTKANRGLYSAGTDGKYLLNGEVTDHLQQAQRLAMHLRDRLLATLDDVPWIQPVLIAPLAYIDFQTVQGQAWVLHEGNLPDAFENAPSKLKTVDIDRCARAVKAIADKGRSL